MTDAPAVRQNVSKLMERMGPELERALPKHIRKDYFLRVALTTVRKTPKLLQSQPQSLLAAMMEAAQLGLPIDGVLGFGHLVPYWNKDWNAYEVTFIPGYKGLMDLALRAGSIHHFEARIVYAEDHFAYQYGLEPNLEHIPADWDDRGHWIATYAIAVYKEGPPQFVVCPKGAAMAVKGRAKAKSAKSPWNTDEEAMALKTSMKMLCKWLHVSPEVDAAVSKDEAFEQARWADLSTAEVKIPERSPSSFAGDVDSPDEVGTGEAFSEDAPSDGGDNGPPPPKRVSEAMVKRFLAACKKPGVADTARAWLTKQFNAETNFGDIDEDAAAQLLEDLGVK